MKFLLKTNGSTKRVLEFVNLLFGGTKYYGKAFPHEHGCFWYLNVTQGRGRVPVIVWHLLSIAVRSGAAQVLEGSSH